MEFFSYTSWKKKDLFKSVEKFKVAVVKKNKHFSRVIHLKVIALSFFDCP